MPRKKVEVVELNKKEEQIVLEEKQSALILFWRRHNVIIFLTFLILSLTILGISLMLLIKNLDVNGIQDIKLASIDISLTDYEIKVGNNALTDESAKEKFLNSHKFKTTGEVLLVKEIDHNKFTIKYYSDGTALMMLKESNRATRVNPLDNGDYGIDEEGVISSKALTSNIMVTDTKEYPWGTVNYFSDGSAEVINSKMDLFVRKADDINDKYISDNKVSYLKGTKAVGNVKLYYYHDGTIEVVKKGTSYLVRNESDLTIGSTDVTFKNNNEATVHKSQKMADGVIIDYYTDGGAIIRNGANTISVRKSNSIVIEDKKVYEIVDSIFVEKSKEKGNITYYTNGSAVVTYNGEKLYVPENSDIKYSGGNISNITGEKEKLSSETNNNGNHIQVFEKTAVVENKDYIAIIPKDKIVYDKDGNMKDIEEVNIDDEIDGFTVTNNTNETINYRVSIKQSPRTTVDVKYLRYQISAGSAYEGPNKLSDKLWKSDYVSKGLNVKGTNYILIERTLDPYATEKVNVMMWTDYDTIPNSEQDKYFYGTIEVYAWTEEK